MLSPTNLDFYQLLFRSRNNNTIILFILSTKRLKFESPIPLVVEEKKNHSLFEVLSITSSPSISHRCLISLHLSFLSPLSHLFLFSPGFQLHVSSSFSPLHHPPPNLQSSHIFPPFLFFLITFDMCSSHQLVRTILTRQTLQQISHRTVLETLSHTFRIYGHYVDTSSQLVFIVFF